MAKAKVRQDGTVVLTMSQHEALYVTAELAGSNSYAHGLPSTFEDGDASGVYSQLSHALDVGDPRLLYRANRHGLRARYVEHKQIADALRPQYSIEAAKKVARELGVIGQDD